MTGSIRGWGRSHLTCSRVAADSKSASSLRSLPQLLLNFQFNNLKITSVIYLRSRNKSNTALKQQRRKGGEPLAILCLIGPARKLEPKTSCADSDH